MKQTLVIGSTVVDVIINLPRLPSRAEDINISCPEYRIGGCAFNVYNALRIFQSSALLCSPVGSGIYGRMVKEYFANEGLTPFVSLEGENGCCYCLIEPDGERSFLSYHGVEYLFSCSWMEKIDFSKTGGVYVSGIEIEDPSGSGIIDFVYGHPELELYFAPGPRIMRIASEKMERLLARRGVSGKGPLLHLNETEALSFSGMKDVEAAAGVFAAKTENSVVVTMGKRGCYCLSKAAADGCFVPGFPSVVVDSVGAGDAHCGALIACLKKGMSLEQSCLAANKMGAAVAGIKGATAGKHDFDMTDLLGGAD